MSEAVSPVWWLILNGKHPFQSGGWWYWGSGADRDPADPDSDEMLLPLVLFDTLRAPLTYPSVRCYPTREAALSDFRAAFARANAGGALRG